MVSNLDLISKVQQAKLHFAKLMDEYVDSFVYSIDRDECLSHKVTCLYELLEAVDYQTRKGYYYDNEVTQKLYEKIDCLTPIYNSPVVIDNTLIRPFIDNSTQTQVVWGGIGGDITDQQDLINLLLLKQNSITLTTLGESGAATFDEETSTLNIPQYKGGVTSFNTRTGDIELEDGDVTDALGFTPENVANKSTDVNLGTSDGLYPSQNAVKTYVDAQVAGATIPDATATVKGKIKLAGDLGGTADLPTVPELANKEPIIEPGTTSQYWRGDKSWQTLDKTAVGLGNVDNTSDADKPISTAQQEALDDKQNNITLTTTGTSGAATFNPITSELNIPEYQGGVTSFNTRTGSITLTSEDVTTALGYTPVTEARTITINGVTQDLSADQDWTINAGGTGVRTQYTFIATAGQTTFTTVGYTVGQIDVYYNGSKQLPSEYVATNGTTVVFPTGKIAGDEIEIVVWSISDITSGDSFEYFSKNLKSYPYSLNYTGTVLNSIVYTLPSGTITKTFSYTGTTLSSIALSGAVPTTILTTKTFTYTGTQLTSVVYS